MTRYVKDGKTIIEPGISVSPGARVSQEEWAKIFPGKEEFEKTYGKILSYRSYFKNNKHIEQYNYWDNESNTRKEIAFEKSIN